MKLGRIPAPTFCCMANRITIASNASLRFSSFKLRISEKIDVSSSLYPLYRLKPKRIRDLYPEEKSASYWDKEKQQPRSHRTLIGKIDKETGEMIPTDGRGKKRMAKAAEAVSKPKQGPVPSLLTERNFYGATYLLNQIGKETGIFEDLKACFPKDYKKILSIAYFLILEDNNPLSRFGQRSKLNKHPYGKDIPSQRSSELFQSITEEAKMRFFRLQGKRRIEKEYWAYDTTSISSYSEKLKQVKYGKNKDNEPLAQINLALLFGETSGLPFYFRKVAGNIPDVKTINELVRKLDILGYGKIKLVMDRGFYSTANINDLYKGHHKFIVGASTSLSYAKAYIKEIGDSMQNYARYNEQYEVYIASKTISWDYTQDRPYKGDPITGDRRMYLHLYYNPEKAVEDGKQFNRYLKKLENELLSGKHDSAHENACKKYFTVKKIPVRGFR